ncbi:thioredoxin family protein [Thalassoroseus pseudoceratinae]|uniref:thioredoxin family protein n=1 Tax=Thalassoroseus pseudoceratinae TaxID=2713176 RepID=UPI001420E928|nr:thioredoxin family protein [Thalassoroseus pseudoceratinae]
MPEVFWTAALLLNVGVFAADSPKECPPAPCPPGKAHVSVGANSEILCGTKCEVSRQVPSGRFELKLQCQLPSEIVPALKTAKPPRPVRVPTITRLRQALNNFVPHGWRGQTLPSPQYVQDDVVFFPPGPEFPVEPPTPIPAPRRIHQVEFEHAPHPQPVHPAPFARHSDEHERFFPPAPNFPHPVTPVANGPAPVACPVGVFPMAGVPAYAPYPVPVMFGAPPHGPMNAPAHGPHHPVMPPMPVPPMVAAHAPYVKARVCKGPSGHERVVYEACSAESSCCKDGCECKGCQCPGCDKKKTASVPVYSSPAAAEADRNNHVLCFGAEWCGPCRQMKPIIQDLISHGCPLKVVNIDEHPEFAKKFNVNVLPSFVAVVDGEPCDRAVGMISPQQIRALVQRVAGGKPVFGGKFETKPAPKSPADTTYPGAISVTNIVEVRYALPSQKGEMLATLLRDQCSIDVKRDDDILTITTTEEKQKAVANFIATVVGPSPPKMASKAERNIAKTEETQPKPCQPVVQKAPTTPPKVRVITFPHGGQQYRIRDVSVRLNETAKPVKYKAPVAYPKEKPTRPACAEKKPKCTQSNAGNTGVNSACAVSQDTRFKLECGPQGVSVRKVDDDGHPLILKCQNLEAHVLGQLPRTIQCKFQECLGLDDETQELLPSVISEEVQKVLSEDPIFRKRGSSQPTPVFSFSIGINR